MEVIAITAEQLAAWKALAEALRARADWLDPPRHVTAPRPYISREQFRAAADNLDKFGTVGAEVERLRDFVKSAVVAFDLAAELMPDNVINFAQFAADARAVLPEGVAK